MNSTFFDGEGYAKGASSGRETVFCLPTVRAQGDPSRAKVSVRGKMGAALASYRNIETEALGIHLHFEKVEALASCIEVIGVFGSVKFRVLGVEKSLEEVPLILLGDSNAKVLNLEKDPAGLLFQYDSNHPLVGGILNGIPEKALQYIRQDLRGHEKERSFCPSRWK
jgi:hypothetical protein